MEYDVRKISIPDSDKTTKAYWRSQTLYLASSQLFCNCLVNQTKKNRGCIFLKFVRITPFICKSSRLDEFFHLVMSFIFTLHRKLVSIVYEDFTQYFWH